MGVALYAYNDKLLRGFLIASCKGEETMCEIIKDAN